MFMHAEAKRKKREKKKEKKTAQSHKDKETNQSQIRVIFLLPFVCLVLVENVKSTGSALASDHLETRERGRMYRLSFSHLLTCSTIIIKKKKKLN